MDLKRLIPSFSVRFFAGQFAINYKQVPLKESTAVNKYGENEYFLLRVFNINILRISQGVRGKAYKESRSQDAAVRNRTMRRLQQDSGSTPDLGMRVELFGYARSIGTSIGARFDVRILALIISVVFLVIGSVIGANSFYAFFNVICPIMIIPLSALSASQIMLSLLGLQITHHFVAHIMQFMYFPTDKPADQKKRLLFPLLSLSRVIPLLLILPCLYYDFFVEFFIWSAVALSTFVDLMENEECLFYLRWVLSVRSGFRRTPLKEDDPLFFPRRTGEERVPGKQQDVEFKLLQVLAWKMDDDTSSTIASMRQATSHNLFTN